MRAIRGFISVSQAVDAATNSALTLRRRPVHVGSPAATGSRSPGRIFELRVENRTIWTLWHQGFADAPPLVQACLESWRRFNPGWRVIALDRQSLPEYFDIAEVIDRTRRDLDVTKISNLTRLCLLRRYGGLWTDATVFCLRPLDDWLDGAYDAGFFAFRNPARDRMMATWLIASEPDNPLLVALHAAFVDFVNRRNFSNQNTAFGRYVVDRLTPILRQDVRRTTLWLNPLVQSLLRAYPYFFFHYLFNRLILTRPDLRALWERVGPIEARPLHTLQNYAREPDTLADALSELERSDWQVQKLNWRSDLATPYWSAVMRDLTGRVPREGPGHSVQLARGSGR